MDVNTGELLSLVSFPEYNSNTLTNGANADINAELNDPRHLFLNRATNGLYAPGSIVKPFMAIAALSEGVITADKKLYSAGYISIPNPYDPDHPTIMHDWEKHGWVNVRDAIALSCDDYFYMVGGGYEDQVGLGINRIDRYMEAFGIGHPTGSPLPETSGVVPSPEWKKTAYEDGAWYLGDTYNTSIGQGGFQVTPLEMVRAVAAIANRGMLVTPTLIKGEAGDRKPVDIAVPDYVYQVVQEGMRQGVTTGITTALNIKGVHVAAKTGTAEVGIQKHYVNSWVTGFFPYENPRYAFALVMERGPEENLVGATSIMQQILVWMTQHTPQYLQADQR
jgi:penicillin-binding protein 2